MLTGSRVIKGEVFYWANSEFLVGLSRIRAQSDRFSGSIGHLTGLSRVALLVESGDLVGLDRTIFRALSQSIFPSFSLGIGECIRGTVGLFIGLDRSASQS